MMLCFSAPIPQFCSLGKICASSYTDPDWCYWGTGTPTQDLC